jgi:Cu2+-exporting ATPase
MARALVHAASDQGDALPLPSNLSESAGQGVSGCVEGHQVDVGSAAFAAGKGLTSLERLRQLRTEVGADDDALAVVGIDGGAAGIVVYRDRVRPGVAPTLERLQRDGVQETVMLTGDDRATAEAIAAEVGITTVDAELLPPQKVQAVRDLMQRHETVVMVGDGINDAPALAQADLGIAIGAGTDVAVETGDVVLMKSDPADVLAAIQLSKATVRKMKQNLFWAAIYNLIAIPIAAGVLYPSLGLMLRPEFGALAMSASSITVVSNALLLRREVPAPGAAALAKPGALSW